MACCLSKQALLLGVLWVLFSEGVVAWSVVAWSVVARSVCVIIPFNAYLYVRCLLVGGLLSE